MPTSKDEWRFQQVFGDPKGGSEEEEDIISSVEFDATGNFLAIGDRGGRVVVLERNHKSRRACEYRVMTEFKSHKAEFDYLKSMEIEEKINQIRWLKRHNDAHLLLTTNDKTIKLWKVYEKKVKNIQGKNFVNKSGLKKKKKINSMKDIKIPKIVSSSNTFIEHTPRRIYGNSHAYHINSISLNSDGETFLSADDLRINIWHSDVTAQSFTFVDIKPENMDNLTEVITSACFHPKQCNLIMYSSSKGVIKLGDLRDSALCNNYAKSFEVEEESNPTFFSEIIASISDAKFSNCGRYILSRDYMTLKIWDINMESKPLKTVNVHESLRSRLCDLYENDCIFDKFECCWSNDANNIITGSYKNYFHIFDKNGKKHHCIEASRQATQSKRKKKLLRKKKIKDEDITYDQSDFSKKVLNLTWHPQENIIAVAAVNNLFIFANGLN